MTAAPKPGGSDVAKVPSAGWDGLVTGTVVLAYDPECEMWSEATVKHILDESITLVWVGWEGELPPFSRKLTQVALLHPSMTAKC